MAKASVLIVEDEILIAESLKSKLQKLGYEVPHIALSGEDALVMAERYHPNLILMDIRLAGKMDGIQCARLVQKMMDVPIIFATSHSDEQTLERVKRISPYGYIIKPFQFNDLRISVDLALHRFQADQQHKRQEATLYQAIHTLQDAILVTDAQGRVVFMNSNAAELTGFTLAAAFGVPLVEVLPWLEAGEANVINPLELPLQQQKAYVIPHNTTLTRPDGTTLVLTGRLTPLLLEGGEVSGVLASFTAAKKEKISLREESRQRHLVNEVLETQDQARKELAHLLHENLGQLLSAAKMNLEAVPPAEDPNYADALQRSKGLLDDAVGSIRKLTQTVSPNLLNDFGLIPALNQYLQGLQKDTGVVLRLVAETDAERLPPAEEYHLFRLVLGLVSYIVGQHQVSEVTLQLITGKNNSLQLVLEDNSTAGCLYPKDRFWREPALREVVTRIRALGATVQLEASAHNGNWLALEVPASVAHPA